MFPPSIQHDGNARHQESVCVPARAREKEARAGLLKVPHSNHPHRRLLHCSLSLLIIPTDIHTHTRIYVHVCIHNRFTVPSLSPLPFAINQHSFQITNHSLLCFVSVVVVTRCSSLPVVVARWFWPPWCCCCFVVYLFVCV